MSRGARKPVLALAVGLGLWLGASNVVRASPASVNVDANEFRVRDEHRDLVVGTGVTVGNPVYVIGSPSPAAYAPTLGGRFTVGSRRWSLLARTRVGVLVPHTETTAERQTGGLVELGLALRAMFLQRRRARFGLRLGVVGDQVRSRSRLNLAEDELRIVKNVSHFGPELGNELAIVMVQPSARRPWTLDVLLTSDVMLAFALRSRLRFEDSNGEVDVVRGPAQLRVLGPFSGARINVQLGVQFSWELPWVRAQSSAKRRHTTAL